MSDIPDEFLTAAASVVTAGCGCQASDIDQCSYHRDGSCRWQRDAIARALMAADEAATKRERERCAEIANDLQYSADATFNDLTSRARKGEKHLELAAATAAGMSHQARKAAAAILKGEA